MAAWGNQFFPYLAQYGVQTPKLTPVATQNILGGRTLRVTNSATDPCVPPLTLTYSLIAPPSGAGIDPASGLITWRPAMAQSGMTTSLTVVVSDSGTPSLAATQQFAVIVASPVQPAMAQPALNAGRFQAWISGDAGPDYFIQVSTNFNDWQQLLATNSPAMPFLFSDPQPAAGDRRFYRVRMGP